MYGYIWIKLPLPPSVIYFAAEDAAEDCANPPPPVAVALNAVVGVLAGISPEVLPWSPPLLPPNPAPNTGFEIIESGLPGFCALPPTLAPLTPFALLVLSAEPPLPPWYATTYDEVKGAAIAIGKVIEDDNPLIPLTPPAPAIIL